MNNVVTIYGGLFLLFFILAFDIKATHVHLIMLIVYKSSTKSQPNQVVDDTNS